MRHMLWAAALAALVAGCASTDRAEPVRQASTPPEPARPVSRDPYPSTYRAYPGVPTAITGATIFDGEGGRIDNGVVALAGGLVRAVGGAETPIPEGATRIDAAGKWVTPGISYSHSHLGD